MQTRFTLRIAHAVLAGVFCAGLCGSALRAQADTPDAHAAPPKAAYKEVVDDYGRAVRIPQPVQRIVSLAPSLTETIYALGLQDRLVGDTDYCDYPADAQKKTKVGGTINPNLEQIVALRPDLVLVTKNLNHIETVQALENLGLASYATDTHTVQGIISSTERLADVLGVSEAGASLGAELEHRLADLQQRLSGLPPRRVLFVVWSDPLISVGKDTFIGDALRWAGASSIVESSQDWPQMNLEEVVRLQPEFLVFAAAHGDSTAASFDALADRPGWRGLEAVRQRHFAVISDAVNRPAPRIVSAIEELARQLHPEAFSAPSDAPVEKKPPVSSTVLQHYGNTGESMESCACVR